MCGLLVLLSVTGVVSEMNEENNIVACRFVYILFHNKVCMSHKKYADFVFQFSYVLHYVKVDAMLQKTN